MTYRQMLLIAFLLNGLLMVGMKAVDGFKLGQYIPLVLFAQYAVGGLLCIPAVVAARKPLHRTSLWVGVAAGITSAIGMSCAITVTGMIPGYMVFPIIQGGTLLTVVIIGRVFFKEKIGPYGVAGIALGTAAIILLSI